MKSSIVGLLLSAVAALPAIAADEIPTPQEIVDRMIAASGGGAFASLGILELEVVEEENRNDGSQTGSSYTVLVDTSNLNNLRVEYPGNVVICRTAGGGWATTNGVIDDRPQTPMMAKTTVNQKAFTLLLPFSLEMEGVWIKEVREAVLGGREVWVLSIPFTKGFFVSPVMTTTWILVVAKDDYSIVSLEFAPAPEFRKISPMGIRYRILKEKELEGARTIEQLLAVGINDQFQESGATKVTKIRAASRESWDPTLFLSPQRLEALEKED